MPARPVSEAIVSVPATIQVRWARSISCQHRADAFPDRQLMHVNKKGRPVSQCHHCRGMRKSRSSHVHCECSQKGHSKEDCPHDKADGKHGERHPAFYVHG
jgi:hypothetical protein